MAWGKSEQEKEALRLEKEARQREQQAAEAARAEEQRRAEFAASPLGRATTAYQRGDAFFQFTATVSALTGQSSGFGSSDNTVSEYSGGVEVLGPIEALGWSLEHVSHVFVQTGSTSTARVMSTGEGTVTRGLVNAIYLFRRAG
ncbi:MULTISPECIES: hypothetical protein [unclassified Isoptericola]|uniref:hypothetical protein n=1 Tax=unclassified Isoptericola TaxID=2623355 RepID=UPI0036575887